MMKEKMPSDEDNKKLKEKESPPLEQRHLPETEVWEASKESLEKPGYRMGFMSRIDYKSDGYRAGLIKLALRMFLKNETLFNVMAGGLADKKSLDKKYKEFLKDFPKDKKGEAREHFIMEAARELAVTIPKIKKQGTDNEFVRLYIITSLPYDGLLGEEIAQRLQELRPEDIRHQKNGARLEVKGFGYIWVLVSQKHRLPSKYYSQAAEREINDKRGQTSQETPEVWVFGTPASSIHKPAGEVPEPYVTVPALHRLEEVHIAENQEGVTVIEYTQSRDRFVRFWNFKDLVAREKEFITGIKQGASETHKKIVESIKREGPQSIGLLTDHLGVERSVVEKEIKFLVEEKKSKRRNWPGLFYDPHSQKYDFHLDWIQEDLRYPDPENESPCIEDVFLMFGCVHAGYTTSDYEFFVNRTPEIILANKVKTLVGLGDFIAGLQHDFLHTGEVFGGLNNTDQEQFAAELVGTVIMKVFEKRLENLLSARPQNITITQAEALDLVNNALLQFVYIPGNHDLWQEREGVAPLSTFRDKLIKLVMTNVLNTVASKSFPAINLSQVIEQKIVGYKDVGMSYNPEMNKRNTGFPFFGAMHKLSSGLSLGMIHPHMARAQTTSLRAQHAIDFFRGCQVIGVANFHTAIVVHVWQSNRGQVVASQVGTMALFTPFEQRKMKIVDFGPVFLRVLSRSGRIVMTESAYFDVPLLKEALPKGQDPAQLKQKLGVLSAS
ncbi:MAG: hypothetical protein HYW70_01005 [Candidatus Nealsonbacteria bacterium]|nr:hypothetical protein [Candidatus Nealsonbacteria bacterium]